MKSKIGFVFFILDLTLVFLVIWFWGFGIIKNIAHEHLKTKNEIDNLTPNLVVGIENDTPLSMYQVDIKNSISSIEIENKNSISKINLNETDRWAVECMVAGEAKGESLEGKMLVAQCIYNAMLKDNLSALEVRTEYQYAGWDENLKSVNEEAYNEVVEAVSRVFDDGEIVVEDEILYFYAPALCESKWHESLNHVITEGCHKFFSVEN